MSKYLKSLRLSNGMSAVSLVWIILIAILIGGIAWWLSTLEKTWIARENPSTEFIKNPMIAATRLLEKRQYQVQLAPVLTENLIKSARKGTLIIADNDGYMSKAQTNALFAWIAQGNTLITFPKLSTQTVPKPAAEARKDIDPDDEEDNHSDAKKDPEKTDEVEPNAQEDATEKNSNQKSKRIATPLIRDPIGDYLGVSSFYDERAGVKYFHSVLVNIPDVSYPLKLRKPSFLKLKSSANSRTPLFTDEHNDVLQVYAVGKGHIAVLSENIFELQGLRHYDHAELLLALINLNQKNPGVTIVQRLKIPSWYELLWNAFPVALCLLVVAIALLFWRAVTRFGPLLPETNWERRSLMEHIEASGRWAWSTAVGRDLLLTAVRISTMQVLKKRAPELLNLSVNDQLLHLAQICQLDHEHLAHAWHDAASSNPHLFTRQIQHLQQLRAHYEH
ncbi:DUF4350 domain-containing protein [Undibacterium sp. Di24W]|uniref:DUF4350 domain-containing protein n=1 Tax=Undibacterium sp. Di24W TaxID=3413033 RepID=UPI003BF2AEEA